jgi:NAD(P)H-hydrate repair Nnr-like enzyme with NAD(P)H-hydrate epimerase domain
MGEAIQANFTYTLHAKKIGHIVNPGKKYSGKISVIDIGIKRTITH